MTRHPAIAATLLAAALSAAACSTGTGGEPDGNRNGEPPESTSTAAPVPGTPAGENPDGAAATLLAVLDGDSLAVDAGAGREEVRLVGINAPEADECQGEASRIALDRLVDGAALVLLESSDDDRDRFGRLLRDVWADGVWVNRAQVASGSALALQNGAPGEAELVASEEAAYRSRLGMWAPAACGDTAGAELPDLEIGDIRYDPPGRDFENKEEEFVSVVNHGATAVELGGWLIRDESSQHRFVFPRYVLDAGEAVRIRTGCGDDAGRDLYWCAEDAVWSNGGDTVLLQLPDGTVVGRFKYPGDF